MATCCVEWTKISKATALWTFCFLSMKMGSKIKIHENPLNGVNISANNQFVAAYRAPYIQMHEYPLMSLSNFLNIRDIPYLGMQKNNVICYMKKEISYRQNPRKQIQIRISLLPGKHIGKDGKAE